MAPPIFIILNFILQLFYPVMGWLSDYICSHSSFFAKRTIHSLLSSIQVGTLVIIDETSGEHHSFGDSNNVNLDSAVTTTNGALTSPPHAKLVVKSPAFWLRVLLLNDLGFAQSYMAGEFSCPDLTAFFRLFILNRDHLSNMNGNGGLLSRIVTATLRFVSAKTRNTMSNALLNAAAHYDISNDMFAAFLSRDMTYSCPIWRTRPSFSSDLVGWEDGGKGEEGGEEESLESAQMTKLRRFIDGARIKPTDHVLEIGTGWGSFAIEAVRRTACRVTTLTLSREQKALAEERIAAAGLDDKIEVLLMDYRALPVTERLYDKVVSIEMLEAVGEEFLGTYFACVNRLLKRDGGIAMFQCITMPEGRHAAYSGRKDFINQYIFPGGYLPSITQLLNHITTASWGTLIVERVENIGGHYARTLRLWRENFMANFDDMIQPALLREHPDMKDEEVDVFRRKWQYYFTYCEAGFLTKTLGDVIITVGREGAMELMECIPL